MGNGGWYGTQEEWERIEAPIKSLDVDLDEFAAKHQLSLTRNLKDWPGRSMGWGNDVRCLIQVYLDDAKTLGLNLWICASQDRDDKRYWKEEFLRKGAIAGELARELPVLLETAKARLDEIIAQLDGLN